MADERKQLSRRDLIRGASLAAVGGQVTLNQQAIRPTVVKGASWPDHKQAAIKAVRQAVDQWKLQARFADIRIMAVSAIGGRLIGPEMTPLIQGAMPSTPGNISGAFARAVGAAWKQWQESVTVPGLPWYPAFAAFPGPVAPPMPNVPCPLAALVSPGDTAFLPDIFAAQLRRELGAAASESGAEREITDFAHWLASNFALWKTSSMVMLVLGKGPIPTFAPPYVPVGPVVMGDNISTPGHLATAPGFILPAISYFDARKSFESRVANTFTVKLENGAAGLEGANAHLFGDVAITTGETSPVKIMVRGAEMTLSQTSAQSRGLLQKARMDLSTLQQKTTTSPQANPADKMRISDLIKRVDTATASMGTMKGSGRLEVMVGTVMIPIPSAHFEIDDKGRLAILGGTVDFKGITHTVGKGSYISPSEMKLVGWIPFANYVLSDSTLTFRPDGIFGAGRLQAFAHTFNMKYDLSGPRMRAAAEVGGPDRGWQSMPFVNGAQYQAAGTRIVAQIDGPNVAITVRVPTLGVRTSAMKPNGQPWAERGSNPGTLTVAVNGDVNLKPPGLTSPADSMLASRQACEAAARSLHVIPDVSGFLVGEAKRLAEEARDKAIQALNAALAECAKKNPLPPPMPQIPQAFRVKVGNLVG